MPPVGAPKQDVIIVTHLKPDPDAVVAAKLLERALLRDSRDRDRISYAFIAGGTTYRGIEVHLGQMVDETNRPMYLYEVVDGVIIYHVDCGGSALDQHVITGAKSSTRLVWEAFDMAETFPELEHVVDYIDRVDQGKGGTGTGSFASKLRGIIRFGDDNELPESDVNRRLLFEAEEWLRYEAANGRRRIVGAAINEIHKLSCPLPSVPNSGFYLATKQTSVGVLGFANFPVQDLVGPVTHRLGKCDVTIAHSRVEGYTRIVFDVSVPSSVRLSVLKALRQAEAASRGITLTEADLSACNHVEVLPVWFGHVNDDGQVVGILNGSPKAPFTRYDQITNLGMDVIVGVVDLVLSL